MHLVACGGLTEWLRSLIGNQVRRNSPVGSSPMSSAIKSLGISTVPGLFVFVFDKNCHKIAIIFRKSRFVKVLNALQCKGYRDFEDASKMTLFFRVKTHLFIGVHLYEIKNIILVLN